MGYALKIIFLPVIFIILNTPLYAKSFGAKLCTESGYTCYTVKRGDSWKKLYPDEAERDLIMRINRMNTNLYKGLKIAIPTSGELDPLVHAPFPAQIDSPGKKTIKVSKDTLAFGAYDENGTLIHWGPISSGKGYCPDVGRRCGTPSGNYTIQSKQGPGCVSSKYPVGRGGAPMPYCMFFHRGFALHGSYIVPGYHDSHGCIRLFVKDAKWLNQEFSNGSSVRVIVY